MEAINLVLRVAMIKVIKAGLWTSIQDRGRFNYKHLGVPVAGCMDQTSADLANLLLNNPFDAAVMEITIIGPVLEFQCDSRIALCGADISAKLNQTAISSNTVVNVHKGDVLSFSHLNYGARAYLSVLGGFQTDIELGSRSFYKGISSQIKLEKGDLLDIIPVNKRGFAKHALVKIDKDHFSTSSMTCLPGPEFEFLTEPQKEILTEQFFTLSTLQVRMGFQIEEVFENSMQAILSSAVLPGTVQLTPSGKLIILMRDCQTTGGYPRVLQLTEAAINQLSQKTPKQTIQFKLIK